MGNWGPWGFAECHEPRVSRLYKLYGIIIEFQFLVVTCCHLIHHGSHMIPLSFAAASKRCNMRGLINSATPDRPHKMGRKKHDQV